MWLEEKSFPELISVWWKEIVVEGWAGHRFAGKLKLLKAKIKEWVKENFGEVGMMKANILNGIRSLDIKEEMNGLSREEGRRRLNSKKILKERCDRKKSSGGKGPDAGGRRNETKIQSFSKGWLRREE